MKGIREIYDRAGPAALLMTGTLIGLLAFTVLGGCC